MTTLELLQKEAPEVATAFDGLIKSLRDTNGLNPKVKQLVYIGIKAAAGDVTAVKVHTMMAKNLGANRSEIRDAILITLSVCGLTGVGECLQAALSVFDQ